MYDPMAHVPRERGYIYNQFGHYYVMRDGAYALNWKELEGEARHEVLSHQWSGDISSFYPLTWNLLEKADFPPREQDKMQETCIVGDGENRFYVRHLEYGKPVDQWRELEVYICHDIEESRYIVESKDGIALNWEALELEARAVVSQLGEDFQHCYVVECPTELAEKARFLTVEESDLEYASLIDEKLVSVPYNPDFSR